MPSRILAMGGHSPRFEDAILELAGERVCFVPTASGDEEWQLVRFYESFARRAEASHVSFNPWPRDDLREHVLAQDAIYVSGGNTANALAVWRVHGFDQVLREALENGILLCGWSAGMICWFEAGLTDSFGPQLEGILASAASAPRAELRRPSRGAVGRESGDAAQRLLQSRLTSPLQRPDPPPETRPVPDAAGLLQPRPPALAA